MIRLAGIESVTEVEGPGCRYAIWLQGCTLGCKGCCNPKMQNPAAGYLIDEGELAENVTGSNTDGLTIAGGEPLQQAAALKAFLEELRFRRYNKGIIIFSGYSFAEINADAQKLDVVKLCDLLVAGRFIAGLPEHKRRWIGSGNQTVHLFSDHYESLCHNWPAAKREIELHIGEDGVLSINGYPLGEQSEFEKILQAGQ